MRLRDLYLKNDRWYFIWMPSHSELFEDEKEHMKTELKPHPLRWHPDEPEKPWSVPNTAEAQRALRLLFKNAGWLFDQIGRQTELFTRG